MLILKKYKVFLLLAFVLSGACLAGNSVKAQLDNDKLNVIKQSCVQAQVILQTIHYNDAATRVNRGQGYETLLSDFINPLNSRAAANGFNSDAASLTSIATRYQKTLAKFKSDYDVYDDTISALLKIKCRDKPDDFYSYLEKARLQRSATALDVVNLAQIINEYQTAASKLQKVAQ